MLYHLSHQGSLKEGGFKEYVLHDSVHREVRTAAAFEEAGVMLLQRRQKEVRTAAHGHRF